MMDALALPGAGGGTLPMADEGEDMDTVTSVRGFLVDSWVEPSGPIRDARRLVLQVAPEDAPATC